MEGERRLGITQKTQIERERDGLISSGQLEMRERDKSFGAFQYIVNEAEKGQLHSTTSVELPLYVFRERVGDET